MFLPNFLRIQIELVLHVMTMETYCICLEATHDGEKAAVVTKKGGGNINSARHTKRLILVEAGQTVHLKCRRHLLRSQKKNATSGSRATCTAVKKNAPVISRRSVTPAFDYQEQEQAYSGVYMKKCYKNTLVVEL